MAICPSGHSSSTDDYCDVCGNLPAHVFAGNTVMARLTLTNRRWWAIGEMNVYP